MITNGPMNVTVCGGTKANISCGYTGVYGAFETPPNWRIIKRNNNGSVISNETVSGTDIRNNEFDDMKFFVVTSGNNNNADGSYLSVGPVDDTYNNTSYQCIFSINDNIIESDTAATITVTGRCDYIVTYMYPIIMLRVYSTRGVVSWQIQHSASPSAVFVTRLHPSCCILLYNTRNGALTSMYSTAHIQIFK